MPRADSCLHGHVELFFKHEKRFGQHLADEVGIDRLAKVHARTPLLFEDGPRKKIEISRKSPEREIFFNLQRTFLDHIQKAFAIKQKRMLRSLQAGPTFLEHAERKAIQSRNFKNKFTGWFQKTFDLSQSFDGMVVMLQEMPHGDEVKAFRFEFLIEERPVQKAGFGEGRTLGKILEVDTETFGPCFLVDFFQKSSRPTADIKDATAIIELDMTLHDGPFVSIVFAHSGVIEFRQDAPVFFLAMSDVLFVIKDRDVLERYAGLLIGQSTGIAGHKGEGARFAAQIILGFDELMAFVGAA